MTPTEKEKECVVDPALTCLRNTQLGEGVRIMPFTNIYASNLADSVFIGPFCEIGGAVIGKNTKVSSHSYICPGVSIGEECFIGHGVMTTNDLYSDVPEYEHLKDLDGQWVMRRTRIGNRVRIGSGAIILPVIIGDDCIIGAGAVVTHDVAAGTTVSGVPARLMERHIHDKFS